MTAAITGAGLRELQARLAALESRVEADCTMRQVDVAALSPDDLERLVGIQQQLTEGVPVAEWTTDDLQFVVALPFVQGEQA